MKIAVFTVYEPTTNIGSYLQAYALQEVLTEWGDEVFFVQKFSTKKAISKHIFRLNPKRGIFLRIKQGIYSFKALKRLNTLPIKGVKKKNIDIAVYGSDEIWNLENSYFADDMFWGGKMEEVPKIAYGVSCGAMSKSFFKKNEYYAECVRKYEYISVRDTHTYDLISQVFNKDISYVCDPTFLLPLSRLQKGKPKIKGQYLLVYSYGVDKQLEEMVVRFAREKGLKIISVHFWHFWCDECIAIDPLEFSSVIAGAEYVFTTTFHGAIFTMLNHKNCAILPVRDKVKDVVERMGAEKHLISAHCTYNEFSQTMERAFDAEVFEKKVEETRTQSIKILKECIKCANS